MGFFDWLKGLFGMKKKEEVVEAEPTEEVPEKPVYIDRNEDEYSTGSAMRPEKVHENAPPVKEVKSKKSDTPTAMPLDTKGRSIQKQDEIKKKYRGKKGWGDFENSKLDNEIINRVSVGGSVLASGDLYSTYSQLFKNKAINVIEDKEVQQILFENRKRLTHRFTCTLLVMGRDRSGKDKVSHIKSEVELIGALPEEVAKKFQVLVGNTYDSDTLRKEIMRIGQTITKHVNILHTYPCTVDRNDVHVTFG